MAVQASRGPGRPRQEGGRVRPLGQQWMAQRDKRGSGYLVSGTYRDLESESVDGRLTIETS